MNDLLWANFEPEPEPSPEWVGVHTDEQLETIQKVARQISETSDFQFHLVLGVAGTGKTQVLLSLAQELRDRKIPVVHVMAESLRNYLRRCGLRVKSDIVSTGAVYLYDDPATLRQLKTKFEEARKNGARAVVVAVDPFQFHDRNGLLKFSQYINPDLQKKEMREKSRIRTSEYPDVIEGQKPLVHWLKLVFRQKSNIGSQVLKVSREIFSVNKSYLIAEKQSEWSRVTKPIFNGAMDDMTFVSDGGFVEVIETSHPISEISKAMIEHDRREDKWTWSPSMLLVGGKALPYMQAVFDQLEKVRVPADIEAENLRRSVLGFPPLGKTSTSEKPFEMTMSQLARYLNCTLVDYEKPAQVRGQEFQEVIISMPKADYRLMFAGREGLGTEEWKRIMPLHTYMTRARHKITIVLS